MGMEVESNRKGKSPFYNLQLLRWFDFQPRCTKSKILQPPTIKTIWISTLSLFQGGFSFFSLSPTLIAREK